MLEFQSQGAIVDAQPQGSLAPLLPGKVEPLRNGMRGQDLADDGGPVGDHGAIGQPPSPEQGSGKARQRGGEGSRAVEGSVGGQRGLPVWFGWDYGRLMTIREQRTRDKSATTAAETLLVWYDRHGRSLPWRAGREPYRVWLAEVMLQQTTVAAVIPYYRAFLDLWPGVEDLAAAELDRVLHAWQGLGYYSRARNLHACARMVARGMGGRFPDTEEALRRLPGIGRYTAAAVAAIAFERPVVPVDGNVRRVMGRLHAELDPNRAEALAATLASSHRPGDLAQALMDLGATVCTPRSPACGVCPWMEPCAGRRSGAPASFPARPQRKPRPTRHGVVFWTLDAQDRVLLRRRSESGLLGGLMEFPSTEWLETPWPPALARRQAPLPARWAVLPGVVRHAFTHFHLELAVWVGWPMETRVNDGVWTHPDNLSEHALPTVMKKVVRHAGLGLRRACPVE